MGKLEWDKIGERRYETGVDHVVLYKNNGNSAYGLLLKYSQRHYQNLQAT